jgi:peptidoglycan/LPS O-acetylase OafA/YrhL
MVVVVAARTNAASVGSSGVAGRLVALDGLRGIAAMVVVFHHIYQIARPYLEPSTHAWAVGSLWWFISATPIKLMSAGSESVLVFFILSGLVVPLPMLGKKGRAWVAFYFSRLLRLYLPVWGSLVFAGVVIAFTPHPASAVTPGSWVERTNSTKAPLGLLFSEAGLLRKSFSNNTVLWSLTWEVTFSLALPLFILAAMAIRRYWLPAGIVCVALTFVGKIYDSPALLYLPVFFLGTLVAVNLDGLRAWAAQPRKRQTSIGWVALTVSLLLIVTSWMFRPVIPAGTLASDALGCLTPVGAAGLVVCAVVFRPVQFGLSTRVPRWLGRVSFSLYLTHLPILVAFVYLFGDRNWGLVAVVGIPTSLGIAYLFFRFVESPSHRLAKRVSRWITGSRTRVRRDQSRLSPTAEPYADPAPPSSPEGERS